MTDTNRTSKDVLTRIREAARDLGNDPPNGITTMRALTALHDAIAEIEQVNKLFLRACGSMTNCACSWKVGPVTGKRIEDENEGDFVIESICEAHREFFEKRRTVETSGKQPDWEAEYKKLAGVYSRTGLEDFIAKHWPGNKLVDVSAEEPRETIGLICYNPCEKHKGMSFTMTIGTPAVLVRTVCPHCEPIRPEEPAGVRIAPEKPIIDGHPIGCMCHGCHYYRKHPQCKPVKASDELRALYNATVDDLNKEQEV